MRAAFALMVAMAATPAVAAPRAVVSKAPQRVALTIYRAGDDRGGIDLRRLDGFALVTETRRVTLPRGRATLRFEGVAEGILPVSAVIDGLPGGVIEKNRDARLLSPAALVDGTLGRQVTLTRTDRATGRRTSEQATVVAGPRPGIVLRTRAGIETLRCAGLPETLTFAGVPADLSARPVLSVETDSPSTRTVTVRLSYLASKFDWRASYVATVARDGRTLDLFAWLTLANGNGEAFAAADVSAVAGRLNRVFVPAQLAADGALSLSCYPLGTTTSDLSTRVFEAAEEIVVTAARMMVPAPPPLYAPAPPPPPPPPPPPEQLGDVKLYRVPERVTVAPRGQKQVALLAQAGVPFERRHRRTVYPGQPLEPSPTSIVLTMRNRREDRLGIPLPSGSTAAYAAAGEDRLLLGLGSMADRAEGETVRLVAGTSAQVTVAQRVVDRRRAILIATNATRAAVMLDVPLPAGGQPVASDDRALATVDGVPTWSVTVPAGGTAELHYRFGE